MRVRVFIGSLFALMIMSVVVIHIKMTQMLQLEEEEEQIAPNTNIDHVQPSSAELRRQALLNSAKQQREQKPPSIRTVAEQSMRKPKRQPADSTVSAQLRADAEALKEYRHKREALSADEDRQMQDRCRKIEEHAQYDRCKGKMDWLLQHWQTEDVCYGECGVDGTACSFRAYLNLVENHCPPVPEDVLVPPMHSSCLPRTGDLPAREEDTSPAEPSEIQPMARRANLEDLILQLKQNPKFKWIVTRLQTMAKDWENEMYTYNLTVITPQLVSQKRVLVYPGLISSYQRLNIAENAFKGGPLGELVQWADLLAALHLLGYEVHVLTEIEDLRSLVLRMNGGRSLEQMQTKDPCGRLRAYKAAEISGLSFDNVFTDLYGWRQMKVTHLEDKFRCKVRILDSFGTSASANYDMRSTWGGEHLDLSQFFTMFPHSPDNTFLGFVVNQMPDLPRSGPLKALVYGKDPKMWEGKSEILEAIHKAGFEVHATVQTDADEIPVAASIHPTNSIPSYVKNHGILHGHEVAKLLLQCTIFVGLGFPYEGPAPLEAVAAGVIFFNQAFRPPHSSRNTEFLKSKPTDRELTSQHPYMEEFVGKPYVETLDLHNMKHLSNAIERAKRANIKPHVNLEFTYLGFLQRVDALVQKLDTCNPVNQWPPLEEIQIVVGNPGVSCKHTCLRKGYVCERRYFESLRQAIATGGSINNVQVSQFTQCTQSIVHSTDSKMLIKDGSTCRYPASSKYMECIRSEPSVSSICPCRTFIPEQAALCPSCVV